jgi:hypothetical protein
MILWSINLCFDLSSIDNILTLNLGASKIEYMHQNLIVELFFTISFDKSKINLNGDVIPVNEIPKIVIANEEAVVVA